MATDRNDSLLAEILGELRCFNTLLGDIRDRLPLPVPVDSGQPAVVNLREPLASADPDGVAADTPKVPRKATARRIPTTPKTGVTP